MIRRALLVIALLLSAHLPVAQGQLSVNELSGFGAGGLPAFKLIGTGTKTAEAGTTITISSVDFGEGGHIVFAFAWHSTNTGTVFNSCTIGGVACVVDKKGPAGAGGSANGVFIASASDVPAGTGSVTATYNNTSSMNGIYAVYQTSAQPTTSATNASDATTGTSFTLTVPAGGALIAAGETNTNSSANNFTGGVVTDIRGTLSATARPGFIGSQEYPSGASPATVTWSVSGTNSQIVAVAYGP